MDVSQHMQTHHKQKDSQPLVRTLDDTSLGSKKITLLVLVVYIVLVLIGVSTGYVLATGRGTSIVGESQSTLEAVQGGKNSETFRDSAEGTIEKGGMDGEGTHKLIRDGGPSQTAFLVSSVVDLDGFLGKKVKVWGETFDAKKASWLMDVGKIELIK